MDIQGQAQVVSSKDLEDSLGGDYKRLARLTRKWEELGYIAINNLGKGDYQCKLTPSGLNYFRLLRRKQIQERYLAVGLLFFVFAVAYVFYGI